MTLWFLMDGRANYDIDAASVLEVCESETEAFDNINNYGADTCVVKSEEDGTETLIWSLLWGEWTD